MDIILDARAPTEFLQGRIPGAINLPLFDDLERESVGICYKSKGQEKAIELGLALVGPKMASLVNQAKRLSSGKPLQVYCARGGMRSSSLCWLLNFSGVKTSQLEGGYRSFRRAVLKKLEDAQQHYRWMILGGLTGSGKSAILKEMERMGEQVLDLEELACHRGSSFGSFGMPSQPTSEQFENEIASKIQQFDPTRPIG